MITNMGKLLNTIGTYTWMIDLDLRDMIFIPHLSRPPESFLVWICLAFLPICKESDREPCGWGGINSLWDSHFHLFSQYKPLFGQKRRSE